MIRELISDTESIGMASSLFNRYLSREESLAEVLGAYLFDEGEAPRDRRGDPVSDTAAIGERSDRHRTYGPTADGVSIPRIERRPLPDSIKENLERAIEEAQGTVPAPLNNGRDVMPTFGRAPLDGTAGEASVGGDLSARDFTTFDEPLFFGPTEEVDAEEVTTAAASDSGEGVEGESDYRLDSPASTLDERIETDGGGSKDIVLVRNMIGAGMSADDAYGLWSKSGKIEGDLPAINQENPFVYSANAYLPLELTDANRFDFDIARFFDATRESAYLTGSPIDLYMRGLSESANVSLAALVDAVYQITGTTDSETAKDALYEPEAFVLDPKKGEDQLKRRVAFIYHQLHPFFGAPTSQGEFGAIARMTLHEGKGGEIENVEDAVKGWASEIDQLMLTRVNFYAPDSGPAKRDGKAFNVDPERIDKIIEDVLNTSTAPPSQGLVMSLGIGHFQTQQDKLSELYERRENPSNDLATRDAANDEIAEMVRDSLSQQLGAENGYEQYLVLRAFGELSGASETIRRTLDPGTGTPAERLTGLRDEWLAAPVPSRSLLKSYIDERLSKEVPFETFKRSYDTHMAPRVRDLLGTENGTGAPSPDVDSP